MKAVAPSQGDIAVATWASRKQMVRRATQCCFTTLIACAAYQLLNVALASAGVEYPAAQSDFMSVVYTLTRAGAVLPLVLLVLATLDVWITRRHRATIISRWKKRQIA